ncbi:MAG: Hsp20/alpha crystallin family protein [Rikenellaceae bacterium]|nr:Hsp20/alpha crystallin family protein [Rikenellaceae bacterium]
MLPVRRANWLSIPSIFNDFFGNEWLERPNSTAPAVNIIENDKAYKMEVAAPGLTKEDCRIELKEGNQLVVITEKKNEANEKHNNGRYLRREFSFSSFRQSMILPENADIERIEAKVDNGILNIEIPKKQAKVEPETTKLIDIK